MKSQLGKFVYWGISKTINVPIFPLLREFEQSERLSTDELYSLQYAKIIKLLEHAEQNSIYYKKVFQELGAEVGDIKNFDDFKHFPILTKSIMREKGEEILSSLRHDGLTVAKTSGSTGTPLKFYKNNEAVASTYAAMYRGHRWFGVDVGAREARLWGVPINSLAKVKSKGQDVLLNRFRKKNLETSDEAFFSFYQSMIKFRPSYLMGYPSFIHSFAISAKKQGLDCERLGLKFVKYTAEMLQDHQKQYIEDVFACQCISEYGAAETGIITFECPYGNHHLMSESVFVEFAETGDEERHGSSKKQKLLVTNLYNTAFPVIRYEIGDLAGTIGGVCPCGRTLPLMSKVDGRISDVVVDCNGRLFHSSIFSYILKDCLGAGLGAREVRFVQRKLGEIEAEISCPLNDISALRKKIKQSAHKVFGNAIVVTVVQVPILPIDPSGKFRYFVSHLP